MINHISIFFIFLILILPISLITGPAIPDLTITFSGIFFLFFIFYKNVYKNIFSEKIFIFSIIFWIYLNFISFYAENMELSFRDSIIFFRILLIPIFLYFWIFNNSQTLEKIVTVVFFTVIFVSLDSLYQFIRYDPEFGFGKDIFGFEPGWYGRLNGPFYKELIPGAYVSKFGLIGLIFLFMRIKNIFYQQILSILYLTLIGIVTFASGERMALATFLLGIFFLIIFYNKKRAIFIYSLFLIIIVNMLIFKSHSIYNDYKILESTPYHLGLKVEKTFDCKKDKNQKCKKIINLQPTFTKIIMNFDDSAYGQIYNLGWKIFLDHKFFGAGLNNFTHLCNNDDRYKNKLKNFDCVSHPHNIYLQWLAECGLIGLIFFIAYLVLIIGFILKNNYNRFSLISLSTIIILFWPIMSTGSLLKNWNGISSFFIIGICLSLSKLKQKT